MVKVRLFRFGSEDSARLLFVVHHLVIDGVSWRILLEDFYAAYQALDAERAPALPAKTTSYQSWAEKLSELDFREQQEEAAYWREVATKSAGIPLDFADGREANTVGSEETVVTVLSASETRSLLQEAPRAYNTQINDILLTALLPAFAPWTGSDDLVLDLEGHGREELFSSVDLSRTVGWFTSLFPVALRRASDQPGEALRSVKEQLRLIPRRGVGYGLMRYLGNDASMAATSDVIFNYLGQTDRVLSPDSRWQPITKGAGPEQGPDNTRPYLLAIDALVSQGRLEVSWVYCRHVHQRSTIEDLADRFRESLLRLVEHCSNPTAGGYTPSDFPAAKLSQTALDKLVAKLNA
jgi:non-ribosomal peptide synthase protein (TIGR01720 family)